MGITSTPADLTHALKLACGHTAYTAVNLRLQYPDDSHFVLCPECETIKKLDVYGRPPTAWQNVVSVREIDNGSLSDVQDWIPVVMPRSIIRMQPSVPINRCRPFPYK